MQWQCKNCKQMNRSEDSAEFKPLSFLFWSFLTLGLYTMIYILKSCMNMTQDSFQTVTNQHYCKHCGTRKSNLY